MCITFPPVVRYTQAPRARVEATETLEKTDPMGAPGQQGLPAGHRDSGRPSRGPGRAGPTHRCVPGARWCMLATPGPAKHVRDLDGLPCEARSLRESCAARFTLSGSLMSHGSEWPLSPWRACAPSCFEVAGPWLCAQPSVACSQRSGLWGKPGLRSASRCVVEPSTTRSARPRGTSSRGCYVLPAREDGHVYFP